MAKFMILFCLLFSNASFSHCGACGTGGSEADHAEGEDKTHHEKDKKFEKNKEKRKEMGMETSDDNSDDPKM